jgi:predicted house-cleaning NTP pyrophosphatase (Maf/HAM1 superfamily)
MPIFNQGSVVRGRKAIIEPDLGIIQQRRVDILKVLEVKFQTVPTEVIEKINKIEDPAILETLHEKAKALALMKQFLGYLQEIGC